jgi:hypothetical protein
MRNRSARWDCCFSAKGAVVAHVFGRPLAVEMDDDQQS